MRFKYSVALVGRTDRDSLVWFHRESGLGAIDLAVASLVLAALVLPAQTRAKRGDFMAGAKRERQKQQSGTAGQSGGPPVTAIERSNVQGA
jgi:hypothetical protein